MQNAHGKAFVFGDDINTDVILPGAYLNVTDPKELASHCMESEDPDFVKNARPGDIMVAQKNFGCGSSREHAPLSIKYLGISCVIASTFARIFFRNALNIGLPILECEEAAKNIKADEALRIGLVNAVYPAEELMAAAEKMAETIAKNAPIAVRACKKAINEGLELGMDDAIVLEEKLFGSCFETADQVEGMSAFLEKRKHEPYQNK